MPTYTASLLVSTLALLAGCAVQPAASDAPTERAPREDVAFEQPLRLPRWTPGVVQAPVARNTARVAPTGLTRTQRARATLTGATTSSDEVRRTLESTRLPSLAFRAEPSLRAVCKSICGYAQVNVHVDEDAEDALLLSGATIDLVRSSSISAASALDLVMELAGEDVAWTTRHGVVLVTTPDKARGEARLTMYDVSDLTTGIPSYAGRELGVTPSGGLTPADDDLGQEPRSVISADLLEDLIRNTIDPDSWDEPGNSITIRGGKLIIRHD